MDIGEFTKSLSLINTLMLRYLRGVQCIWGEFLAGQTISATLFAVIGIEFFSSNYRVGRRETTPTLATLWLGRKKQRFSGTNQKPELHRPFGTGPLKTSPQGLFFSFLTFLRPNLFPLRGWLSLATELYDLVKIKPGESEAQHSFCLWLRRLRSSRQSRQQEEKNKPMTMFNSGPCDWLVLPLLLPTPTTQFSLDHKQRSRM